MTPIEIFVYGFFVGVFLGLGRLFVKLLGRDSNDL